VLARERECVCVERALPKAGAAGEIRKTRIIVPLVEAVAKRVPFAFIASAATCKVCKEKCMDT
jgi:hypothetical protein